MSRSVFATRRVMLVELLGAIRPFELMPFARHTGQGNRHQKDGKKFHRAAS
jgi:hypothetical protein